MGLSRRARCSRQELALRDELLERAVSFGVLREEWPFYVFHSGFDSLKTMFSVKPQLNDAAPRLAEAFLG